MCLFDILDVCMTDGQVSMERDELQEENSTLEAQIGKLQSEMEEKLHAQPLWGLDPSQPQDNGDILEDHIMVPVVDHATQAAPIVGPIFVMPLHDNPLVHPKPDAADTVVPKLPPKVSRPHARYPCPSDSWPSHILSKQPKDANHTTLLSSSCTSSSTKSRED